MSPINTPSRRTPRPTARVTGKTVTLANCPGERRPCKSRVSAQSLRRETGCDRFLTRPQHKETIMALRTIEKYVGEQVTVQFGPHKSNQASGVLERLSMPRAGVAFKIGGFVFTELQIDRIDSRKKFILCK